MKQNRQKNCHIGGWLIEDGLKFIVEQKFQYKIMKRMVESKPA